MHSHNKAVCIRSNFVWSKGLISIQGLIASKSNKKGMSPTEPSIYRELNPEFSNYMIINLNIEGIMILEIGNKLRK